MNEVRFLQCLSRARAERKQPKTKCLVPLTLYQYMIIAGDRNVRETEERNFV